MSTPPLAPGGRAPVHFRPSWQLRSAALVGVALAGAAVVLRRLDLAVLALPFLVQLARAAAGPPASQWQADPVPEVLEEGAATTLGAAVTGAPAVVTVAVPGSDLVVRRPALGACVGAGRAGVDVEPVRWGRHQVGEPAVVATDPDGLWRAEAQLASHAVRVRPRAELLRGGSGVRRPLGIQGEHLSGRHGEGTELAEVREYRPGDRLRRITWNRSSRGDDLFVVDAYTERDTDVLVVLDSIRAVQAPQSDRATSLDLGVRATLAVARHYLSYGDRVGVFDMGERMLPLAAGAGPRQLVALHERLSTVGAADSVASLRHVPRPRPGTLVFVCTPLLEPDVVAELGRMRSAGAELVVVDTLPEMPRRAVRSWRGRSPEEALVAAWRLRLMAREEVTSQLARAGVPVARWTGPGSLAAVLQTMELARERPRVAP